MSWTECKTQRSCPSLKYSDPRICPSCGCNLTYSRKRDPETPSLQREMKVNWGASTENASLWEGETGVPVPAPHVCRSCTRVGKGQVCLGCLVTSFISPTVPVLSPPCSLELHFTVDRRPCVERQLVRREGWSDCFTSNQILWLLGEMLVTPCQHLSLSAVIVCVAVRLRSATGIH